MSTIKPITAAQASVTTITVEIRTLRVGAKQMTLAVFRQLPRGNEITGPMWGWVNYHPDNCADDGPDRHVVWQDGDELRRAWVAEPLGLSTMRVCPANVGEGWVAAAVLEGWRPEKWPTTVDPSPACRSS
jgi:hypothetical protein